MKLWHKVVSIFFLVNWWAIAVPVQINLIWQMNRAKAWEEDWLNELFAEFEIKHIDDVKYQVFMDNSIIVVSSVHNFTHHKAYFEQLKAMNYKFGIILLSDEYYKAPTDFYPYAQFVFRNYWHRKFSLYNNVYIFPLGYKTGFWKNNSRKLKDFQDREYIWSFAGQINKKPTREAMILAMKKIPKYYFHETFAWADPNSLSVDFYQSLLLNSIFVPCPTGWWNLDSFRIYEALECGCIPIVEKGPIDYFKLYFENHPFIVVDSWDQAPEIINTFLENPLLLEQHRLKCHSWWFAYKEKLKKSLCKVIRESLL